MLGFGGEGKSGVAANVLVAPCTCAGLFECHCTACSRMRYALVYSLRMIVNKFDGDLQFPLSY